MTVMIIRSARSFTNFCGGHVVVPCLHSVMVHYRVFIGAPSASNTGTDPSSYTWKTTENTPTTSLPPSLSQHFASVVYPPATLDAASRRISVLYQGVIFGDTDDEEEQVDDGPEYNETSQLLGVYAVSSVWCVTLRYKPERTSTFITWPSTPAAVERKGANHQNENNANTTSLPSFLLPSQSQPRGTYETQETVSYAYSDEDTSTIARFPNFQFSLHTVTSLSSLSDASRFSSVHDQYQRQPGSRKANILVTILEVEGPDTIKVKKGLDAGKEVSILKMILGDEEGCVCRLTAWRDTAEVWGGYGLGPDALPAMKRGDVVYFESESHAFPFSTWTVISPAFNLSLFAFIFINLDRRFCHGLFS